MAFAGVAFAAAMFVGIAVNKYRASRSPHAQGFIEVDQVGIREYSNEFNSLVFYLFIYLFIGYQCPHHARGKTCSKHAN